MVEKNLIEVIRDLSDEECIRILEVIKALAAKEVAA